MRGLQLSLSCALLATCSVYAALLESEPDYALILSRQAPGTPHYQCHSDCGNALAGGRNPAHCTNSTWVEYYEACLDCALDFDIWKLYGNGVSGAASACGLSATPSPSGDAVASSSSIVVASSSSAVVVPSSSTIAVSQSSTAVAPSGSDQASTSSAAPTEAPESVSSTEPTTTAPPSTGNGTAVVSPSPTSSIATAGAPRSEFTPLGPLVTVAALVAVFVGLLGA